MKIVMQSVDDLIPYENNPRNNEAAISKVAESIREFGFKVPIIVDKDNTIIAGHTRVKACNVLGIEKVPTIVADDLTDDQVKAFRLADNKVSEFASWDYEALMEELEDISLDMESFGFNFDELEGFEDDSSGEAEQDRYTEKVEVPLYEIRGGKPTMDELFDAAKYEELVSTIQDSDIPEEVKQFLIHASSRHIGFNFSNIAEYYAHADEEIQELMEQNALVIIDYDDAIANGYTTFKSSLEELLEGAEYEG